MCCLILCGCSAPYQLRGLLSSRPGKTRNIAKMEQALAGLQAPPLDRDEWGPVAEHTLPGFRRLATAAGMVNVVDALPGVGGYDQVMENADLLNVSKRDVRVGGDRHRDQPHRKEAVGALIVGRPPYSRMMDGLHVLMCKETLAARKKQARTPLAVGLHPDYLDLPCCGDPDNSCPWHTAE